MTLRYVPGIKSAHHLNSYWHKVVQGKSSAHVLGYFSTLCLGCHRTLENYSGCSVWVGKCIWTGKIPDDTCICVQCYVNKMCMCLLHCSDVYMVSLCCDRNYSFGRTLFVLAHTPPPGSFASCKSLWSFPAHRLSHLAVCSSSVSHGHTWELGTRDTRIRNPFTPSQIIATASFQWHKNPAHLLLGTWYWRWHTTDQWAAPVWCSTEQDNIRFQKRFSKKPTRLYSLPQERIGLCVNSENM